MLVALPFLLIWRGTFDERLRERSHKRTAADRLVIALSALMLVVNALLVALIITGLLGA